MTVAELTWQQRSIAARGALSLALRGAEVLAHAVLIVVTARLLGPEGRGLYALSSLTATLCVVPLGSVWSTLALDVAKRRLPPGAVLAVGCVVALVGGAAVALVALVASLAFGPHWWVVAIPASVTPALLFLVYAQGIYQALGHAVAANTVLTGRVAVPLGFLSVTIALGGDIELVVIVWAVSVATLVPLVFLHLRAVTGPLLRPPRELRSYAVRLALAARFLPANTALLVNMRIALLALAVATTTSTVGVYSVAVSAAELMRLGSRALYSSVFGAIGSRDAAASAALTVRAIRHSVLLAASGSLLLVPTSVVALPVVLGPGYSQVPVLLALLVPGVICFAAFPSLSAYFGVQVVRPELVSIAAGLTLVSTLLGIFALVPLFGAAGAAASTSVAALVGVGFASRCFCRSAGASLRAFVPGASELRDYASLARRARAALASSSAELLAGEEGRS